MILFIASLESLRQKYYSSDAQEQCPQVSALSHPPLGRPTALPWGASKFPLSTPLCQDKTQVSHRMQATRAYRLKSNLEESLNKDSAISWQRFSLKPLPALQAEHHADVALPQGGDEL